MDLGLSGKVVLVSASSSGIGRAVAEAYAREGAKVAMCARNEEALAQAVGAVKAASGNPGIIGIPTDLTDAGSIENFVFTAAEQLGPVDVLVNNAGNPPEGGYFQLTDDDWWEGFQGNFMSMVALCRNVVPGMKAREFGRIVNIASSSARQPIEGLLVSNAVRAGALGFAKSIAMEFAPYGITVNTVLPGYTETPGLAAVAKDKAGFKKVSAQEIVKGWQEQVPMGRLAKPAEIAGLCVFLGSAQAGYITGQAIAADGGLIRGV